MGRAVPGAVVTPELASSHSGRIKALWSSSSHVEPSRVGICEWINLIHWAVVPKYLLNEWLDGWVYFTIRIIQDHPKGND